MLRPVLAALAALFTAVPASAAPLDLMPREAGLIVAVERPRALAEAARELPAYRSSAKALPAVREFLDSTPARRFFQFVAFAEKELSTPWPVLLDKVAGDGMAFGVKTGMEPAPTLLVIRGTDEQAVAEAFKLLVRVVEDEIARQLGPKAAGGLRKEDYHGTATVHGDEFHAARVGRAIFLANKESALTAGLDIALGRKRGASAADVPSTQAARKLLGGEPLAWLWFDLAAAKKTKQSEDFFANAKKDLFLTLVIGGTVDVVRRSDFVAAGVYQTNGGFALSVRLPAKRADLPPELVLHVPPEGKPGSLPLLEPPGVIYSQSFYLDFGALWTERNKLVNEKQIKDFEKGVKEASRFLPGASLDKLFEMSGPYHRIVMANRADQPYSTEPNQPVPPIAVVTSMRDPAFGKSAASAIRAGALLASFQVGLKMTEEKHDGVTIVSYRFPETGDYPAFGGDPEKLRFNFVPCFAVVGDSLVGATRPELIKDLIPELKSPPDPAKGSSAVWRAKSYAAGFADVLRTYPEPTITNAILSDGVGLDAARKQVDDLVAWAKTLGSVELSADHTADAYVVKLAWKVK